MPGGRWQVASARCQVPGGKCQVPSARWHVADGRWQVPGAKCQVACGRWQVAGGRWQVAGDSQFDGAFYARIGMEKNGDSNLELPPPAFGDLERGGSHFTNRIVETGVQCENDSLDDGGEVVVVWGADVDGPAVRVGSATSAEADATSAGVDATSAGVDATSAGVDALFLNRKIIPADLNFPSDFLFYRQLWSQNKGGGGIDRRCEQSLRDCFFVWSEPVMKIKREVYGMSESTAANNQMISSVKKLTVGVCTPSLHYSTTRYTG